MEFHVKLLAGLFAIWGALTMVIGASMLALGVASAALVRSAAHSGNGSQFAAGLTAATFAMLALLALAWGAAHVVVGTQLRRRRHWSRLAALVLGAVDLLLFPFGTALGVYTLWTLLRERSKPMFAPTALSL